MKCTICGEENPQGEWCGRDQCPMPQTDTRFPEPPGTTPDPVEDQDYDSGPDGDEGIGIDLEAQCEYCGESVDEFGFCEKCDETSHS